MTVRGPGAEERAKRDGVGLPRMAYVSITKARRLAAHSPPRDGGAGASLIRELECPNEAKRPQGWMLALRVEAFVFGTHRPRANFVLHPRSGRKRRVGPI